MNTAKRLLLVLCIWACALSLCAQSLEITRTFEIIPSSSVTAMYKNQFGHWEKPLLDETFPYTVIRVVLEGNAHEVTEAKKKIGLYLGLQRMVLEKSLDFENEILFLIPAGAGHVEIQCGDGCERQTIIDLPRLNANQVYYGKVHYIPVEVKKETEVVDKEQIKQEVLAELAGYLSERNTTETDNQIVPTPAVSQPARPKVVPLEDVTTVTGEYEGHEYVDLGLSVKWATCNVGAIRPEDNGDYFAWGELQSKKMYNWRSYTHCTGSATTLTKYCTQRKFGAKKDNKKVLECVDDVAFDNWGGSWRMPTQKELEELHNNCTWTWMSQNGMYGYKVTSNLNGNSIFLRAGGFREGNSLRKEGSVGYYWSSSVLMDSPDNACMLILNSYFIYSDKSYRCNGLTVRPVCP